MWLREAKGMAAATAVLVLAGCGGGGDKPASQVAVKVNKDEISVHQINEQLAKLGSNLPPERKDEATRQVIAGLINQNLLIEQALEKKLDRDPEVLAALEAARRQILSQAFVQKTLTPQARPTEDEVKKYYADNPALFAQRRVYRLVEIAVTGATTAQLDALQARLQSAKSLAEVVDWLRDNKVQFAANSAVRAAEQLPLEALPRVAQLKDGQVGMFRAADGARATVLQVVASQSSPVEEKDAGRVIEQFLTNRKRDELAKAEVERLRSLAKIDYVGDFGRFKDGAPAAAAAAGAPAAAAAAGAPTAPAAAPVGLQAEGAPAAASATATEKGIAGLR